MHKCCLSCFKTKYSFLKGWLPAPEVRQCKEKEWVYIVHDEYESETDLGMLSCYRENLSGTSSLVIQFMYCSLGSFTFKSEFWHQFGSLVAFFLPKSVLKPILTGKKEKNVIWQCSMTLICSACRV